MVHTGDTSTVRTCRSAARLTISVVAAACVGFVQLILPSPAIAQHNAFVEAVAEFTAALSGSYGDEAVAARAALDRLQRGLAEWDRSLREYESNVAAIGPTASASRVLDMHRTMGMLYLARGRFDDAGREFDAAVARSPEPLFHLFRALAHEGAGRPADALRAYATASMLDRTDPIAAYLLAAASVRAGSSPPKEALATLIDVVDGIAAGRHKGERDPFIATAFVPDDLSMTPVFVPWWYSASYALLERAEYEKAVGAMRTAAAHDPLLAAPVPPALGRGADALRAGQVARAIDEFTAAVRDAPGSEGRRMLGVASWLAADDAHSIEELEHAIRLSPTDERARLMLIRVLEETGETGRAERLLVETLAAIPSSASAHFHLGRLYAAANRTDDAVREYEAAVGIGVFTGRTPLLLDIGALHLWALDFTRAEAAFGRAVALTPNDAVAHRERGRALLQLERPEAAFVELAAALLIDPRDYESCLVIAQIHLDAGRDPAAVGVLTYATALDPDRPEAHYALATALTRSGRRDEAAARLETFARLQARALAGQRRLIELSSLRLEAGLQTKSGEFDRAVASWTRLLEEGPEVAANHVGLAAALAGLGQLAAAAAHYERALALDGGTGIYRQLATLYDRMGRPDRAAATRAKLAQLQQQTR
jgi:tetratricopeptide (TPR) repeat protein